MLASDEFGGRAPATPGGARTTEYLAKQLADLGIEPGAPNGTFFQEVPIVESVVERNFVLSVPGNTYKYYTDVVAFSGVEKPRVQVQGEVVFVGYGINAPELKWNDYAGVDVRNKWVMIMVNDPPAPADEPTLFGGAALTYYGRWTYKFEEAARQGAAGALLIHTDESATYPWQVVQSSWSGTQYSLPPQAGEPALGIKGWITNASARDLARRGGRDLDTLRAAASKRGFKAVALNTKAAATLMQKSSRKTASNVIGVLKGDQSGGGRRLHGALGSLRHARAAAERQAGRRPHLQRRLRQRVGLRRRAGDRQGVCARRRRSRRDRSTSRSSPPKNRGCSARVISPPTRRCRWTRSPPTSTSTASTTWGRRKTWCSSGPIDRRWGRWSKPSSRNAAACWPATRIPSAVTSSARITSRSRRPACRRCR